MLYSLPRTSGIKMIDFWLIFTLFIPFAEVCLHTKLAQIKRRLEETDNTNTRTNRGNSWIGEEEASKDVIMLRFSFKKQNYFLIGTFTLSTFLST